MDEKKTILLVTVGSHMFGTATPASDHDQRGVVVSPLAEMLSPFHPIKRARQYEVRDSYKKRDVTEYELNHFIHLVTKGNPTLLETLYSPLVDEMTLAGAELRTLRPYCLDSHAIYQAHRGFAVSQLRESQKEQPSRPRGKLLSAAILGILQAIDLLSYQSVDPTTLLDETSLICSKQFHRGLKNGQWVEEAAPGVEALLMLLDETAKATRPFQPNFELLTDFLMETYTNGYPVDQAPVTSDLQPA